MKDALNTIENNKAPGSDGLTKEFFETFVLEIKGPLLFSIKKDFSTKELCTF